MTYRPRHCVVLLLFLGFLVQPAQADPQSKDGKEGTGKATATKFLRILRDAVEEPTALETSVTRYVPVTGNSGLTVDLVGVVHVADKVYYQKLNKLFEQYDVVLYELVAPQGTRPPKGGKREGGNPLAIIQEVMKTVLDLESQMEHIDYTKKNFVHADLSFEEMAKAMEARGDTGMTVALSVVADLMRQQNLMKQKPAKPGKPGSSKQPESLNDIFNLFLDPSGPSKFKQMLAEQFEMLGDPAGGLGQTLNTILIGDRNAAAMKVFQKELAGGKKKIAIFYGAAHMADFEKRLVSDFGLKKQDEKWLTAWDLKPRQRGVEDLLFKLLKEMGKP